MSDIIIIIILTRAVWNVAQCLYLGFQLKIGNSVILEGVDL